LREKKRDEVQERANLIEGIEKLDNRESGETRRRARRPPPSIATDLEPVLLFTQSEPWDGCRAIASRKADLGDAAVFTVFLP
jgi:hypothetical protein